MEILIEIITEVHVQEFCNILNFYLHDVMLKNVFLHITCICLQCQS
jgi:hypothetical protein